MDEVDTEHFYERENFRWFGRAIVFSVFERAVGFSSVRASRIVFLSASYPLVLPHGTSGLVTRPK